MKSRVINQLSLPSILLHLFSTSAHVSHFTVLYSPCLLWLTSFSLLIIVCKLHFLLLYSILFLNQIKYNSEFSCTRSISNAQQPCAASGYCTRQHCFRSTFRKGLLEAKVPFLLKNVFILFSWTTEVWAVFSSVLWKHYSFVFRTQELQLNMLSV